MVHQSPNTSLSLDRRQFIQLLLAGTIGILGRDMILPEAALAENAPANSEILKTREFDERK